MSVVIQIQDRQSAFSPGDRVTGQVSWQLGAAPKNAELRLLWRTEGRGIEDDGLVEAIPFPNPQAVETRPFSLTLPDGPYSFSGALITLTWTLEVAVDPGNHTAGVDIVIAPGGKAVSLPRVTPK
ncbi:MAG: hypothetical protein ABJF10_04010 [Chthoniobacter sp.]|uniref:hypothetical protein n=1 Tax=Chthoniobacter sp. TaxID=2510640 RepID=UPI0032A614A2